MMESEKEKLLHLEEELHKRVVGSNNSVSDKSVDVQLITNKLI